MCNNKKIKNFFLEARKIYKYKKVWNIMDKEIVRMSINSRYGPVSLQIRDGKFPLLFLHGLGATANTWKRLTEYLDYRYKLLYLDLLGHGSSAKPEIQYNIPAQCNTIYDVVADLKIDQFSLIGNSYGGWISLYFSIFYRTPEYLVLIDSAGLNPGVGTLPPQEIDHFVENIAKNGEKNKKEILKNIILNNASPEFRLGEKQMQNLDTKVMIIWGANDHVIDIKYAYELKKYIKNSTLHILEGAGHAPHFTDAARVGELIKNFIKI